MIKQITLSVVLLLFSFMAFSQVDTEELRLLGQHQQALRWDNIEVTPNWLAGIEPKFNSGWGMHTVTLSRGATSSFRLEAYQTVRLYQPNKSLQADDVSIYLDNGTGLAVEHQVVVSADGHSLLLSPQSNSPLVVHLTTTSEVLELGLFRSRHEISPQLAYYRTLLPMKGMGTWLGGRNSPNSELFWLIAENSSQTFRLKGPSRIRLRSRLVYEPDASEINQNYRIKFSFDGKRARWLEFVTTVDERYKKLVEIDDSVLGRVENGYIDIPAGEHQLTIKSEQNLYLQLLQQTKNDYLIPHLNASVIPSREVHEQALLRAKGLNVIAQEATAIAKDNRYQDGGMRGGMLLQRAALKRPDYPEAMREARRLLAKTTFYQSLYPTVKGSLLTQFEGYFIAQKLRKPYQTSFSENLSEQHLEGVMKRISKAPFTVLSAGKGNSYVIPKRFSEGQLRILVDKRNCKSQNLWFKEADKPAISLQLLCDSIVEASDLGGGLPAVALKQFQITFNGKAATHPVIANKAMKREWIPVATFELPIQPELTTVRLWQQDDKGLALNVALQYRASKAFELSESSYLSRLVSGTAAQHKSAFFEGLSYIGGEPTGPKSGLQNEWLPLQRGLLAKSRLYGAGIIQQKVRPEKVRRRGEDSWKLQAESATKQKKWVEAIEYWGHYVNQQSGHQREQGQFEQAMILQTLGENYLAENLLRYLSLHGSEGMAKQVFNVLKAHYQSQDDLAGLERAASAMSVRWKSDDYFQELLASLMLNGQYRQALLIGLAFLEQPSVELMLKASYQLRWWKSFQHFLNELPEDRQVYWLGLQAQKEGDYAKALKYWGDEPAWAEALKQGLQLRNDMQKACGTDNLAAFYRRWIVWQAQHPGTRQWKNSPDYVVDYKRRERLLSLERGVYSSLFRAEENRPVKLIVLGPAKLKFKVKVLHPAEKSEAINGWLSAVDNGVERVYPIASQEVVQGVQLVGEDDYKLGRTTTVEYDVGEGSHTIELFSRQAILAVAVNSLQPEMPLTALPSMKFHALKVAMKFRDLSLLSPTVLKNESLPKTTKGFYSVENCNSKGIRLDGSLNMLTVSESKSSMVDVDAIENYASLNGERPRNLREAEHQLIHYVWLLEQGPQIVARTQFNAERLTKEYGDSTLIQSLYRRVAARKQWQEVGSIKSSSGVQFVAVEGWQPENPSVRIRKALLPVEVENNEHVIFADQRLLFAFNRFNRTVLSIDLRLEDIPYLAEGAAQLSWSIDDGKIQQLTLRRGENWKRLSVDLPAGSSQLRFYQTSALSNQFIKLKFDDRRSDLSVAKQRRYFVSTQDEPLSLYIKGPTRLRIDEWAVSGSTSTYQEVPAGWQTVVLKPNNGQKERLIRVKQQRLLFKNKVRHYRVSNRKIVKIPEPVQVFKKQTSLAPLEFYDAFTLGRQEDGTWSAGLDFIRRNNTQEEDEGYQAKPEQFTQFSINHRYFNYDYWNSSAFLRHREYGNPSLGFTKSVLVRPNLLPFNSQFDAKSVIQEIEGNVEFMAELKARFSQRYQFNPKLTLIPNMSFFTRYLSLKNESILDSLNNGESAIKELDQDVYSPYKEDHLNGLKAGLTMQYKPWLDTLWELKLASSSNENMDAFSPDNLSGKVHWKQLLGGVSMDFSYRLTEYKVDKDRDSGSRRRKFGVAVNWQNWLPSQNMLELAFDYGYDQEKTEHLGMLSIRYHFSGGRRYRDFKPGSIDFRGIRDRYLPGQRNNR